MTKFEAKYRAAQKALQELLDCDKSIDKIEVSLYQNKEVILLLDLWAHEEGNEKVVRKVEGFIPDFILEEHLDD